MPNDAARKKVSEKSTVTPRIGRYVGSDGLYALVDLGDQRLRMPFKSAGFVPQINESVWVESVDGSLAMVGPNTPKPGVGVILTITGTNAVVRTDFGDFSMVVAPTDPMPTSGEMVGIHWSTSPWCTLLVDVPEPPPPPPAPTPTPGREWRTVEFRAVDAGSTDRGSTRWWTGQPRAGNSTYGAWFPGTQIKDTVPADAEFGSLEFYVNRVKDSGGPPRFTLHSDPHKAGIPAMSSYWEWDPPNGWQVPPNPEGIFNELKAGGGRYGFGLNQGGDNIFASLAQDGQSGAIRIKWR